MKPRGEDEKKSRFQIEKLEERIAPSPVVDGVHRHGDAVADPNGPAHAGPAAGPHANFNGIFHWFGAAAGK
jgi:hypothetical protein